MTGIYARALIALGPALVLAACGSKTEQPAAGSGGLKVTYLGKASIPKDKADMVFQQTCMACHATGVGPVITGRGLPPEAIKLFVRNGNRAMPAFTEAMIDNETLDRVARMVSESKAPTPKPAT
jgi:mono/diheme cytochrome c family protein